MFSPYRPKPEKSLVWVMISLYLNHPFRSCPLLPVTNFSRITWCNMYIYCLITLKACKYNYWCYCCRDLGENIEDDELRAMIDEFDLDKDGESKPVLSFTFFYCLVLLIQVKTTLKLPSAFTSSDLYWLHAKWSYSCLRVLRTPIQCMHCRLVWMCCLVMAKT